MPSSIDGRYPEFAARGVCFELAREGEVLDINIDFDKTR